MGWLESTRPPLQPATLPKEIQPSVVVWNSMKGIDWNGLPYFVEMFGIDDVEGLINDLLTIRDFTSGG